MSRRKDMQAVCAPPTSSPASPRIPKRFCVLGQIMQREEAKKKKKGHLTHFHNLLLLALPLPAEGVCVCVSNVHQCMILFPATNATGRQQGSFQSSLKSPYSTLGAPNLDVNAVGDRKASFTLTCGCITWMSKKREMIGSETSPRLKSLTMSLFQPRTHTPFLTGQFSNVEVQLRGWSHTQCII